MPFSLRYVRRYLRMGYPTPRSFVTNCLYISLVLFTFSVVASQLSNDGNNEAVPPHPNNKLQFDLHNQLQQNRQKIAEYESNRVKQKDPFADRENVQKVAPHAVERKEINGQPYPKLINGDKFVPLLKFVHLDLKGGAYKPSFFPELFSFFNRLGLNGILLEWEDMFPYTGKLAEAVNGNAYSMADVEGILQAAKDHKLEVIPLVQTVAHLEWILKLEPFKHLREDKRYPQVICFAADEAYELVKQMVDQVAAVHKRFGMNRFHMGADEVFQVGYCNATIKQMQKEGSKDRVLLWHIARVAKYIKNTYSVTVLAWHDMFGHVGENDLRHYEMTDTLEPVLWSYAEDLDQYLPYSTWLSLKPFKRVWGSSAIKGADGPMRYNSNPMHYIRNHESWTTQMNRAFREFDYFMGLVITGWSRYDHMAILAELLPVNLPTLAMSIETVNAGQPMQGNYPWTTEKLQCDAKYEMGFVYGCQFPGRKIYELVNQMYQLQQNFRKYAESDYEFNGWLSKTAQKYSMSSPMYLDKIVQMVDYHLTPLEQVERDLRREMAKIYYQDTIDEFIFNYLSDDLELLRGRKAAISAILAKDTYQKRPFVIYPGPKNEL